MQFEKRPIAISIQGKPHTIEAMVATSVGLAYHPSINGDEGTYDITHVQSGLNILRSVEGVVCQPLPTEHAARSFIALLQPFTDWKRPKSALQQLNRATVYHALKNAYCEAVGFFGLLSQLIQACIDELYEEKGVIDLDDEMTVFQADCEIEYDFSENGVSIIKMCDWLIFVWWMNGKLEAYHSQSVATGICGGCGATEPVSELYDFHGRNLCNSCRWVGLPRKSA